MAVDAGTIYSEVRIQLDKIKGDLAKLSTNFNKFAKENQARSTETQKTWTKNFEKINLAGVAAFAGIGLAVKGAVGQFAEFEQSMANVQSVARATPEEFAKIEAAAREAGETTKFSATEAASALYSLASAGLDATDATEALDGVLQLAGATGSDLAFTSATITAALSQYGLSADKATDISNSFAAAIGNSQANMQKLSTAMRQVGPVAGAFGLSIEQTIGPLQALFDAGFQGEQAGTALRNILSSLANEADPTVKKLGALGFAFEDLNPAVNSVVDIVGTLNNSNIEAGDIIAAFGKEAGPQLLSLLKVGANGLRDYEQAVTGTNAAAEAYAIQMDTMQGGFAEMRSAIESASISFVKEFAPAINLVVGVLTKIIKGVSAMPGPLKIFFGVLTVGIPVVTALVGALASLPAIFGALLGPVSLVIAGIAGVTAVVTALTGSSDNLTKIQDELKEATDRLDKSVSDYEETTRQLEKALKDGNLEEAKTLKLRQDLLKTQVATNLKDTLKVIKDLTREQGKQNKSLSRLQDEYDRVAFFVRKYERALQDEIIRGQASSLTAEYYRNELKAVAISVQDVTERLNKQKSAVQESELARQESIDTLAEYLNAGQIELSQIKLYDKALAEEIFTRAKQLRTIKEQKEAKEEKVRTDKEETAQTKENTKVDVEAAKARAKAETEAEKLAAKRQAANDKIAATVEDYRRKLEDLNATQAESLELSRERAKQEVEASEATDEKKNEAIDAINKYHDALIEEGHAYEDISKQTEAYEMQLLRLVGTEEEVIEAERRRAIAVTETSGATDEAIKAQIMAINKLYDEMAKAAEEATEKSENQIEEWADNNKKYIDASLGAFKEFVSALDELLSVLAEKEIDRINKRLEAQIQAINDRMAAELEAAGLTEETREQSLRRQLTEAVKAGDKEEAEKLEQEIKKLEIENKYRKQTEAAELAAAQESAQLKYKAALAQWKIDIAQAIASAALSIANIWATWGANPVVAGIFTGISGAATKLQIDTIQESKPDPPQLATGGIVLPAGAGGRTVTMAENGSPELALNAGAEGSALLDEFAQRVARAGGSGSGGSRITIPVTLKVDGRIMAEASAEYYNNGQVELELI